jgi:hypothetical protein
MSYLVNTDLEIINGVAHLERNLKEFEATYTEDHDLKIETNLNDGEEIRKRIIKFEKEYQKRTLEDCTKVSEMLNRLTERIINSNHQEGSQFDYVSSSSLANMIDKMKHDMDIIYNTVYQR